MRPSFPTPQCLQPICHPSKFPPRTKRIQGTIQKKLSFQIDGFLTGLSQKNDFRLPIRLQELLQAPLCFLRSFCFARIRLDPLCGQVLHHDCISMMVSRFTTFTENFVICCNQIHEVRLRQCVFSTGLLSF